MKKINALIKAIVIFLVMIVAVFIKATSSVAADSIYINGEEGLKNLTGYYCANRAWNLSAGTYYLTRSDKYRSDSSSQKERALAYILYNGYKNGGRYKNYNHYNKYQIALYLWLGQYEGGNTGYDAAGYALSDYIGYSEGLAVYNEAMNQGIIPYTGNASISLSSNKITMENSVGSFKLSSLTGSINSIEVTWQNSSNSNETHTETITAGNSGKSGWVEFYSNNNCTNSIKINNINTSNVFYIKNLSNDYIIKNIKFNVSSNASGYEVTRYIWEKSGNAQNQRIFSCDVKEGKPTQKSLPVNVEYPYGKLKIIKQGVFNKDGQQQNEDVKATFKLYCKSLEKWVVGDAASYKTYSTNMDEATNYVSGQTITQLYSSYNYELVEVSVDNPYYSNPIFIGSASSTLNGILSVSKRNQYGAVSGIKIYSNKTNEVTIKDERTSGDLIIHKVDNFDKNYKLSEAKMIIYSKELGWIVKNDDQQYSYTNNYKEATRFITDNEGTIKLSLLKYGTYYIYEVAAPRGYDLTKQDNYDSENKWVNLGSVVVGKDGQNTVEYTFENKKIVTKITGIVWNDIPSNKDNLIDNIYHEQQADILLENIKVNLVYLGENNNKQVIATTYTNKDGKYEFKTKNSETYTGEDKNLYYSEIANCYVEFIYDNQKYICATPFVDKHNSISNNSKAQEYQMDINELDDNELTGVEGKYPGIAVTYSNTERKTVKEITERNKIFYNDLVYNHLDNSRIENAWLTDYYDEDKHTIEYINLGLVDKHTPQFDMKETLAYIKIKMNDYTYTYQYGGTKAIVSENVPIVRTQQGKDAFSASIYPTDIAYNIAEKTNELQVYVVYRIDVTNTESVDKDEIYKEGKMYLSSLTNKYDSSRYALCNNENNADSGDFGLWEETKDENQNAIAKYNLGNNNNAFADGIESQATKTSYIQFKMKEKALEKILKKELTEEDIEEAPTTATAEVYHEYLRTDSVWVDNGNVTSYHGCKGTSYYEKKFGTRNSEGKKYYVHKSISSNKDSSALYIRFTLGNPRTISGTVFEDTDRNSDDREALGNGILDTDEETRAQGVKVELLNKDKNTVSLYQVKDKALYYSKDKELPKAETSTNEKGEYSFEGVVPGYYYIRFTYGDGSQKLVTADTDKAISSQDYKSTIINTEKTSLVKEAMEANSDNIAKAQKVLVNAINGKESNEKTITEAKKLLEWYKYIEGDYSIAVDDLAQREALSEFTYKEDKVYNKDGNEVTFKDANINAYSPMLGISIENDINNEKEITKDVDKEKVHNSNYNKFNFGIITQSETKIDVEKKIKNVDLTLQTGTKLVSSDPANSNSKYVTALDKLTNGGSKNAKAEIDPDLVYGTALATTYEITITNNSQKDYKEEKDSPEYGNYYKYGFRDENSKLKITTVEEVVDNIDAKYDVNNIGATVKSNSNNIKIEVPATEEVDERTDVSEEGESTTTTKTLKITGWQGLETSQAESVEYTVTSLLSADDDLEYGNKAKITSIKVDELTTLRSDFEWGNDMAIISVVTPTGQNRSYGYLIVGVVALGVLAIGIVIIKKKVL